MSQTAVRASILLSAAGGSGVAHDNHSGWEASAQATIQGTKYYKDDDLNAK